MPTTKPFADTRLHRMARFLLRLRDKGAMPLDQQSQSVQRRYYDEARRILRVADATRHP